MTSADGLRIREAVRAVVRTPDRHVLLVRFEFPMGRRWALPGGGIDPGETPHAALRRELHEELGLTEVHVGRHVWNRLHIIPFVDGRFDGQREQIFLVDVDTAFEPQPALTWTQLNAEFVHELRWWHIDEIDAAADEWFVPQPLGRLLRALSDDGPPPEPIDVPI
ncbi:MAG: NUDIX domain-containing protein [Actinobacteria bacterium]|nr:NUDIX domain-containing protein [Actinomycetota bacterium]